MATSRDADSIIHKLNLHYGNKNVVAKRIIGDIQNLPDILSNEGQLVCFATALKDSVNAFKLSGYLQNPDLIKSVVRKMPSALKYSYNRFALRNLSEETDLEKLSSFLMEEAEIASAVGIFDLESTPSTSSQSINQSEKRQPRVTKPAIVCTTVEGAQPPEASGGSVENKCKFCDRGGHQIDNCRRFVKEPWKRKHFFVKNNKLCFVCLKAGHQQAVCRRPHCQICQRRHHALLHRQEESETSKTQSEGVVSVNTFQ